MKVIIAAAGTGGHINPGIAIANKIKQEEPNSEIIFIGTPWGLENDLVPRAGYPLKTIEAYGINRKINLDNVKRLYKTIKAIGDAKKIMQEFKPDIVIGTGGYISVSVGKAAKKCHIPLVLHESNAFPGMAVKLLAKDACILTGFEDAKKRLPKAKQVIVTGNPSKVKKITLSDTEKIKIKEGLGFKQDLPIVFVFGGSQGAQNINKIIFSLIEMQTNQEYNILWSAGAKEYERIKKVAIEKKIDLDKLDTVKIVPYVYNMEEIYNIADLIVARSGAMTITEISIVGKPAIFIPLPHAAENHQEYNAKVLVNVGAAQIILEKDLTVQKLHASIIQTISNPQKVKQMGINAEKIAPKEVENRIYKHIKQLQKSK